MNNDLHRALQSKPSAASGLNDRRESESHYRLLFENNPQPMWVFDDKTLGFLVVNEAAVVQYGYSRDEFLSMTIQEIRPVEDIEMLQSAKTNSMDGFGRYDEATRWRHRRKNGEVFDVAINWHKIVFNGRSAKLVLARDVTEQRRAEEALRASERRYRDVFTFAPVGIYQSLPDGTLIAANEALARMLGYESAALLLHANLGRDVYVNPDDQARLNETYNERGYSRDLQVQWKKKNGTPIWIELTAHSIRRDEEEIAYVEGFVHEITDRKRMEDERQVISEIIQGVINTADLNELLSLVHRSIAKYLYAENCFVALYDEQTQLMHFPFWIDKFDCCPEPRAVGLGFNSYVFRTGKPMIVSPERTAEMYARGEVEKSGSNSASWMGVPLRTPTRTIGVLVVQHYEEKNVYDERDLEFLNSVGSQLALAIERKRAEQALKESEERYHRLVELSPDAIVIHQEGRFVFVNSAAVRLTGARDASQLIGKSIYDIVAPEFEDILKQRVKKLYQGELSPPAEIRGRRFDGVEVDCELDSVAYQHHDRFAVLAVVRDISERKRAEQALREANERALTDYERLVERIAMLGTTLANARDLRSIFYAFRDFVTVSVPCDGAVITMYDKEKEVRRAVYCWVDGEEVAPVEIGEVAVGNGIVGQALKSGRVNIDNDFRRLIGNSRLHLVGSFENDRFPRSSMTIPMSVLGRTIGCIEIQTYEAAAYRQEHATAMRMAASLAASAIENVTSTERAQQKEEQLRQAQKMEAVGQLAGGVAHDFNNLLTVINGYSDLSLRSLDEKSPLRPRIEEIRKAGERAASLTRQLLAFSRKQMLQPRVLDLNKVISEMGNMVRRLVGEDILFDLLLASDLGKIKADSGQIEQVLLNLVVNARDVMPTGGHLTIETRNVYVNQPLINRRETLQAGHYVVLSVSDDGCGMDTETQERIFEPFFTTKELGKGTGLGLATVYGIVRQSEGYIWVYSEVDKGATFKVYLPRVDVAPERIEVLEARPPVRGGQETILLVEDEDIVRNLAREVLQQYGYTVITAENGEEGLRVCREFAGEIDLVLTDVVMPRMSGRELAEQLAAERPGTRVLYMSGFTDDSIVRHGLLEEDIAFIQKPFTPESLATKIRELLDHVN